MFLDNQNLAAVSNFDLAMLMLNRLWRAYDEGGISNGRAERAALLEAVTRSAHLESRMDGLFFDDFLKEAVRREPSEVSFEPGLFTDIALLSLEQYSWLVLDELRKWYTQDPESPLPGIGDHYVSIGEKKMFDPVARLLNVEKGTTLLRQAGFLYSNQELIEEGRERRAREISEPLNH